MPAPVVRKGQGLMLPEEDESDHDDRTTFAAVAASLPLKVWISELKVWNSI